jgi:hypothetical protein
MSSQKNITVGLRALTSTINNNHSNIIRFDLTRCSNLQDNIHSSNGVNNQFNSTKNGLNIHITGWSCKSSTESNIEQALISSLNRLSIVKKTLAIGIVEENLVDYSMLLLSFDRAVSLISLELGWIKGENNASLLTCNNGEINSFSGQKWP